MMRLSIVITIIQLFVLTVSAQIPTVDSIKNFERAFDKSKTKYSFKYDLLSEILQVGLNKGILQGNENDVSFKSTVYGLMVLFNKDYEIDKNYSKLKFQRNLEIGGSMQLNSEDERINGFGFALKYAIINKRDLSEGEDYRKISPKVHELQQFMADSLGVILQAYLRDTTKSDDDRARLIKFLHDNNNIKDFNAFFNGLRAIVSFSNSKQISRNMAKMQASLDDLNAEYDAITKEIEKRPLLTFSAEGKNAESKWEFAKFKLEYTKGLGFVKDDQNPWDLYLGAFWEMNRDSLAVNNKLNRSVGTLKGGINHVLIKKANNQSFVEALGGFTYNSIFNGKYDGEKTNQLNALFNLTFRIAPNLYLPVEVEYDPDKGRFMGRIRIKWDMIRDSN